MSPGKDSKGWCADNMSLYAVTTARFGQRNCFSMSLSAAEAAAKPCARLPHDNLERVLSEAVCAFMWLR